MQKWLGTMVVTQCVKTRSRTARGIFVHELIAFNGSDMLNRATMFYQRASLFMIAPGILFGPGHSRSVEARLVCVLSVFSCRVSIQRYLKATNRGKIL